MNRDGTHFIAKFQFFKYQQYVKTTHKVNQSSSNSSRRLRFLFTAFQGLLHFSSAFWLPSSLPGPLHPNTTCYWPSFIIEETEALEDYVLANQDTWRPSCGTGIGTRFFPPPEMAKGKAEIIGLGGKARVRTKSYQVQNNWRAPTIRLWHLESVTTSRCH